MAVAPRNTQKPARHGAFRHPIGPSVWRLDGDHAAVVRRLGRDHHLALALWQTGWFEARILASFVDEPAKVTSRQMDRWAAAFDNWAVCDSTCFHLFDRTPHAWTKGRGWSRRRPEFVRRAAFATLAGLAVHHRTATDRQFLALLPLIETAAAADRNVVKKAVI